MGQNREALEADWRQKAKRTRAIYLQASDQHTRMVNELASGAVPAADGSFAVAKARRAQALARSQYARTLRAYRTVLQGHDPPPEPDEDLLI